MLIMFSLFGRKEGDLDPLQGAGVVSCSRSALAGGGMGGPPSAHSTARDLSGLYLDPMAMWGVLNPHYTSLQRFRLGWLGKNHLC